MKIIGLAGPSGTGKSTIGKHLAARGGVHIDADRVGHELLAHDDAVIEAVVALAGPGILDPHGAIDRGLLGARVFNDADLRRRYNEIIHPAIRRRCGELVAAARSVGRPFVVVDAALLLDSSMPFAFDLKIALDASPDVRRARLVARGDRAAEEVDARLRAQAGLEKSFYKADRVLNTDGTVASVTAEIDKVVDALIDTTEETSE